MSKGPHSKATKKDRLLKAAQDIFGFDPEELQSDLDNQVGTTVEDLLVEAESLHQYLKVRGKGFRYIECRHCNSTFAYHHSVDNIKFCSTACASIFVRESYGISWTPNKPAHERWGLSRPLVVPGHALQAMRDIVGSLKDHEADTSL